MDDTLGTGNLSGTKNVCCIMYLLIVTFKEKGDFCITYPHIYLDNLYDTNLSRVNSHEISVISHHDGLKVS